MKNRKNSFLEGLETIGELVSCAMIFIAIAALSYGLGQFVHLLEANGGDPVCMEMLRFLERAMLLVDVVGLLRIVVIHAMHKPFQR